MGSSSRTDETIFSWSLVGRQIPAPYQYFGNNGTEESHTIHTPFFCHDFYRQYNSGLLYQLTRRSTFPRPMRGGMGNSPLEPGTRYCTQNLSYRSRQIQYISRSSLKIGKTSQYRMVFGSIGGEFHFSNAQLSQCGFVCDSIQSQTPIECISSSGQSSFSDIRIVNELVLSICICISTNNSDTVCSSQDTSILVQNSSYCSSLASTFLVLRGVTTTSFSSDLSSMPSKITKTSKRKSATSKSPISGTSRLGVIKQSIRDKKFLQKLQILSQNQDQHLLGKSTMQMGRILQLATKKEG